MFLATHMKLTHFPSTHRAPEPESLLLPCGRHKWMVPKTLTRLTLFILINRSKQEAVIQRYHNAPIGNHSTRNLNSTICWSKSNRVRHGFQALSRGYSCLNNTDNLLLSGEVPGWGCEDSRSQPQAGNLSRRGTECQILR